MALINHVKREINAKLIYFGPAQSGKSTNLNVIYKKLKPECRGKLKSMAVQQDRMLFFDFTLPGHGNVDGYHVRFHVYTLAGKVTREAAWKTVLKGADGVVFVADSAPNKAAANRESLTTLQEQLQGHGKSLPQIPCVIQCNKRDLSGALPLEEIRQICAAGDAPLLPAIARKGEGVFEALSRLVQMVVMDLRESGLELEREAEPLAGLAAPETGTILPVAAEVTTEPGPVASAGGSEALTIEMGGAPVVVSGGGLRVPMVVRCSGKEQKIAVTVTLSLEPEETD
jgi:signal recognition particle receptor subunit beta